MKLDAWTIFSLALIRRAFPGVPCAFVYRDPLEVLVSHLGHRGHHMIPGALAAERLGLAAGETESMAPERYIATVLARLCEAAAAGARAGELTLIDYRSLPGAVPDTIAPLFGLDPSAADRERLARVANRDAKNPYLEFAADSATKRDRASGAARTAATDIAGPAYAELERLAGVQA
jgi:hypothetical protein